MIKVETKPSLNGSLMTGYFKDKKIQKIKFEKICHTVENGKTMSYSFNLYMENVPEKDFLYMVKVGISFVSKKADEKIFDIGYVEKFNHFTYKDTNTLKSVIVDFPSSQPSLAKIWQNPVLSSFFRDFLTAYTPSGIDHPIDIGTIYSNRLYYPREDFEKLLYSSGHGNNLIDQIKAVYRKERVR